MYCAGARLLVAQDELNPPPLKDVLYYLVDDEVRREWTERPPSFNLTSLLINVDSNSNTPQASRTVGNGGIQFLSIS